MELRGIEELIDRLSFRIEALIKERDELRRTVSRLNACACERDKECVLTRRELNRTLEETISLSNYSNISTLTITGGSGITLTSPSENRHIIADKAIYFIFFLTMKCLNGCRT